MTSDNVLLILFILLTIVSGMLVSVFAEQYVGLAMCLSTLILGTYIVNERATNRTGRRTGTRLHRNLLLVSLLVLVLARALSYLMEGFPLYAGMCSLALIMVLLTTRIVSKFENKKPFLAKNLYLLFLIPMLAIGGHFLVIKGLDKIEEHFLVILGELLSVLLLLNSINRFGATGRLSFALVFFGSVFFVGSLFISTIEMYSELVSLPRNLSAFLEHTLYFLGSFLMVVGFSEQIKDKILNVKYFKDQKEVNPFSEIA